MHDFLSGGSSSVCSLSPFARYSQNNTKIPKLTLIIKVKNNEYWKGICVILHEIFNGHFFRVFATLEHTFTPNANAAKILIISKIGKADLPKNESY